MSFHPKDHPLPAAQKSAELAAAEAKYCLTAFDLAAAPLGSHDWTLYWAGWHARSRGAQHASHDMQQSIAGLRHFHTHELERAKREAKPAAAAMHAHLLKQVKTIEAAVLSRAIGGES